MKILVIGAAGMIGRKLVERLARDGALGGPDGSTSVHLRRHRRAERRPRGLSPRQCDACDIAAPYVAPKLIAERPDVIFLLASIVSGEAEADFDKGYAINLDGTRMIFEAIRREQARRAAPIGRASSSPRRSPCSARPSPRRSTTSSSRRR